MEFKDTIKKLRTDNNLTMDELAKKIGVSAPTIQRYESGEIKNVRKDKIKKLADALHTTPACLMGWEEPAQPQTIAAHLNTDGLTEAELEDVADYIEYIKNKRKK